MPDEHGGTAGKPAVLRFKMSSLGKPARWQIASALDSLNSIIEQPQPDLRPQYQKFVSNVRGLESSADEIGAARRAMADRGKAFFGEWDRQLAQMNNEDAKTRSQSRKDEVMRKLTNLKLSYTEAAMGFKPFMTDLKDAEKALSVDLTIAGAAAIKGPATKARQDAVPLNTAISKLAGEFKALGLSMSSVTP